MDVLVLGGDGFVGRHLVAELVGRGHDVTSLSRSPDPSVFPDGVATVAGDVTEYETVEAAFAGRDAVVNLVALSPLYQPSAGRSHADTHVRGTLNAVRAARERGVGTLFQMSALGADATAPAAYFRAKAAAETAVRNAPLEWVTFRPAPMFGAAGHFVPYVRKITTSSLAVLPGGGDTRFQPVWIGDAVPVFADALEDDARRGAVYELGGPDVLTLAEVTDAVHGPGDAAPTTVSVPMPLATLGSAVVDPIPLIPFGLDQTGALRIDTVTADNCVDDFGVDRGDMRRLSTYLADERASPDRPG